jgi:hypothetical protein
MHVDRNVFLSIPSDFAEAKDLANALNSTADRADRIVILSAYYGTQYMERLLAAVPNSKRPNCCVQLVFGAGRGASLVEAVETLREMRSRLTNMGFKTLFIGVVDPGVPFHTKL